MGIYSYHRLAILDNQNNTVIKGSALEEILQNLFNDYDEADRALTLDGSCNDEAKWYDASDNLKKFSKKYPEYTFILGVSLCAPESKEEEGEYFEAFRNGDVRHIYEPSFMQAASLFSSLDEVKEAALVMSLGEYTDIIFKLSHEKTLDLIYDQLKTSSFAEQTDKTLTIMSFGGSGSSVTVRIQPEQEQAFWEEAERVLVE